MVSNNRFLLGLGVSGPQVVEGLHGASFAKPLSRLRETVDVVRMGLAGEKLSYQGNHIVLPRPGGEGKAIRLSQAPQPDLPIYLATLGPASLKYTGAVANGWLGTSFIPEHADVFFDPIREGATEAGRNFKDIDIHVGGSIEIGDDVDAMIAARKPAMAFTLGGMGSAKTNFYNNAFRRSGYSDVAEEVQQLWAAGKRDKAAELVPDEMILSTSLIGTEQMVKERLRSYKDAGVTTFQVNAGGTSLTDKIARLERAMSLFK